MAAGIMRCMYCGDNLGTDIDHFEPISGAAEAGAEGALRADDLVRPAAAQLAHRLGDVVEAVDVALRQQSAVRVDGAEAVVQRLGRIRPPSPAAPWG
jgi:hypothetical protein